MILVLIEGTYALGVHYEALEGRICTLVDQIDGLIPDPETFRARIYRWAHPEATIFLLFQQYAIQEE